MILKINGVETDYDRIHSIIEKNSYDSIGEAIADKIQGTIHNTEWYQHTSDFNIFKDYEAVKNMCRENPACLMDAVNRSVMETTEPTKMIYRLISHRVDVVKNAFANNFLPEEINWELVLDCILWF